MLFPRCLTISFFTLCGFSWCKLGTHFVELLFLNGIYSLYARPLVWLNGSISLSIIRLFDSSLHLKSWLWIFFIALNSTESTFGTIVHHHFSSQTGHSNYEVLQELLDTDPVSLSSVNSSILNISVWCGIDYMSMNLLCRLYGFAFTLWRGITLSSVSSWMTAIHSINQSETVEFFDHFC